MILLIISALMVVSLGYFVIYRLSGKNPEKNIGELSDANYLLKKDIELSRKRAMYLQHSLEEVRASMAQLQIERNNLLNKQYDLLYYQKENLKKWADEVKN